MNQLGVAHSSPVQQMVAAGSPNWWSINNTKPPPHHSLPPHHQYFPHPPLIGSSSSWEDSQDLPESWSQLLLGGLVGEEDKTSDMLQARKLENWEEQFLNHQQQQSCGADVIKQENSYDYEGNLEFRGPKLPTSSNWSHEMISASSPKSCVTTLSTNMLDFSHKSSSAKLTRQRPDPNSSHECNSTATGGAAKKARIQPTSAHSTFKVRKEKLGDRVTALHQLVSPFGKTDTASVLLEAIGYIRFLQSQIEALSVPYLGSGSRNLAHQHPVQGERNSLFPEDPGQLLNKKCIKRKGLTSEQQESCDDEVEVPKKVQADLRSRGLCLVPISCTLHVGSDINGADYWAPGNYF